MSAYTQDGRFLSITTPLGKDELLLTDISGIESISSLFEFHLTALSENTDIEAPKLINKSVSFSINNSTPRVFNGIVSHFSYGEIKSNGLREYHLTVVPWTWFLDRNENRRIFQNKNCKDIVSQVFSDLGFSDFDFRAAGGQPREYCVQYGESDYAFVMRLLAEEGYACFYTHEEKKHTFVIVDQMSAYAESEHTNLTYSKGNSPDAEINSWVHNYAFKKGEWVLNDYNFKEPNKNLVATSTSKSKFDKNNQFSHYDYSSLYDFSSGSKLANARMDAEEADADTITGSSSCSSFSAGQFFKLDKHEAKSEQGKYLLLSVQHHASDMSYFASQGGDEHYSNNFNSIPLERTYRPAMIYDRPVMYGPQSALVTGPSGEEIYIDEYGRIKVQFMWDREGKKDENSSCFVRVMQAWAGNGWGSSFIPRIGQEVIINFLDGDPDRPIVTGAVYNGNNKPPYSSKTQSGIKTHSTKKGSADNYNEIRFEDKKDGEQIYIHAEKDLDTQVENNETLTVDNDRIKTVKNDEIVTVKNDRTKTVKHDENITIDNDRNKIVNNNQTENVAKNKTIEVGGNHKEHIVGNMNLSIDKNLTELIEGKHAETVSKEYDLQAKTITIGAEKEITIETGSAKIHMKSNGDITISGKKINLKGSGNIVIKGSKVLTN